ncbi:MAG: DUF134 domain-containing protein [Promethearchaeota archaeon]
MARPRKFRQISPITPKVNYFYPKGIDEQTTKKIYLAAEEFEALRLRHDLSLKQTDAANEMGISQTTYSRMLTFAYEKLTQALLHGHAIALQTHRFSQGCPMDLPTPRRHRNRNPRFRNQLRVLHQVTNKTPLTQFKGWGCSDCGYVWKDASRVPIKPLVEGNPRCPECKSNQTYRLIKKLTSLSKNL